MAAEPDLKYALKLKLRRKYASDLVGLKRLSDEIFSQVTEQVTITQQTFEGGSSTGSITCPRSTLLLAIEEIIQEIDPTAVRPSNASVVYFKSSPSEWPAS